MTPTPTPTLFQSPPLLLQFGAAKAFNFLQRPLSVQHIPLPELLSRYLPSKSQQLCFYFPTTPISKDPGGFHPYLRASSWSICNNITMMVNL